MSIDPKTQSNTNVVVQSLSLNALDAPRLAAFYQDKVGLSLLSVDEAKSHYALGTADGRVLLSIYQTDTARPDQQAGLYHMAFRVPSREDLAAVLRHLIDVGAQLSGASDHGYSEALYLDDPEGNGIEIYRDKANTVWDVRPNGQIGGVIDRLDLNELISLAGPEFSGIAEGSDLGHMHLHVADLVGTWRFYREILGLGMKLSMGHTAIFLATGSYHHHLGANIWRGRDLTAASGDHQGLRSYTWKANKEDYATIRQNLDHKGIRYTEEDHALRFFDNSGIALTVAS